MTDYYKVLRENLFQSTPNKCTYICNLEIPKELKNIIYSHISFSRNKDLRANYIEKKLTEQNWAELEQVCRAYESPLMKALA